LPATSNPPFGTGKRGAVAQAEGLDGTWSGGRAAGLRLD
jgi:hypothetical protein